MNAADVIRITIALLRPFKDAVQSNTADNGKVFRAIKKITAALSAGVYFSLLYRSWERGLKESTNGLLRQYSPKDTGLKKVTQNGGDKSSKAIKLARKKRHRVQPPRPANKRS